MKSIVAQTGNQMRPQNMTRVVSVLKDTRRRCLKSSGAVCNLLAQLKATPVEFRWTPHLASLVRPPDTDTYQTLWRPYVNFNTRLTRKLSGAMERRGSSINFLGRSQSKHGPHAQPSISVLPVRSRYAPKTVQGRKWPIWRQSSVRPLLLPSSNLWTGVLSQRFYGPRLRPAEEEVVERRPVPQLLVTKEQSEEEELQLQRRRDTGRVRHHHSESPLLERNVESDEEEDQGEQETERVREREREHRDRCRRPYILSELMTPELATKWLTREPRSQPSAQMVTQTWTSGSHRRHRSRRSSCERSQVVSELEDWRRSANHQPVPIFQGQPVEQEHLRHASCKTSARSMKDVQEMVWEPKKQKPWSRSKETASTSGPTIPTIRAAKSALLIAQESRGKQSRLITKELVYRPDSSYSSDSSEQDDQAADHHHHRRHRRHRSTGGGVVERALLKEHFADLLFMDESKGPFRIGYHRNAPTRQLLEQGKCHVSLRREQFFHLQPVRPNSLIQAVDLEVRESPRQAVTTLHRRDGARRPRPVETVVKPSLLTMIRQDAVTWEKKKKGRQTADQRSSATGARPKKEASMRRLVRNASSLELIRQAATTSIPTPTPTATATAKATATVGGNRPSLVNSYHKVMIKKLPLVNSQLDLCQAAAHPFKDLEEPRTKEKEVATSWKQANAARNYKYEASTSYWSRANPGKKSSVRDMTEGYFLARRSSSTSVKGQQTTSSRKVKPPRQPVVNSKVQVPPPVYRERRAHEVQTSEEEEEEEEDYPLYPPYQSLKATKFQR
ncbi:protein xmas-1 [Drosophila ficusphila]|uniref:protein xmas-1 n=1 Tax=Drosophila ficusphila TaxID=30025 RepID=UPI0007E78805|nr:protein xmas-1 [Drosophila ficusphila]